MTRNTKGRSGWHQAALKTSSSTRNSTGLAHPVKAAIVTLALWGLLPVTVADWIIRRCRLGGAR